MTLKNLYRMCCRNIYSSTIIFNLISQELDDEGRILLRTANRQRHIDTIRYLISSEAEEGLGINLQQKTSHGTTAYDESH